MSETHFFPKLLKVELYQWLLLGLFVLIEAIVFIENPLLAVLFVTLFMVVGLTLVLFRCLRGTIFLLLFLLPFYPLTLFAIESRLDLAYGQALALRSVRDLILLSIFALLVLVQAPNFIRRPQMNFINVLILFLLFGTVPYLLLSKDLTLSLFSLRENFVYLVAFFIAQLLLFRPNHVTLLARGIVISSVIVCLFGLMQAYVLGPQFLARFRDVSLLFVSAPGFYGLQRVVGTFAHAPELAIYLLIPSGFVLWFLQQDRGKTVQMIIWTGVLGLFLLTIVATFARSTWIGLVLMLMVILRGRWALRIFPLLLALGILVLFLSPLKDYVLVSISGNEPSANYHVDTFFASLAYLIQHPLGTGLGSVGTAGLRLAEDTAFYFEGFFFNLAGELGLPFAFYYVLILGSIFFGLVHIERRRVDSRVRTWARVVQGIFAGWAVTGFFLPVMVSREVAFTMWFILGMTFNLYRTSRDTEMEKMNLRPSPTYKDIRITDGSRDVRK